MQYENKTNVELFNDVNERAESLNFTIQSCKEERDSRNELYNEYMSDYMTLRESCISDTDIDYVMCMMYEGKYTDYEFVLMSTHAHTVYTNQYLPYLEQLEKEKKYDKYNK